MSITIGTGNHFDMIDENIFLLKIKLEGGQRAQLDNKPICLVR
jgi:hypothetical protein